VLGLVYLLIKEDTFKSKKYAFLFSALLFLVVSTRPVEGVAHIILPLILFFIFLINKGYFSKKNFLKIILAAITFFTFLLLTRIIPSNKYQIDRIDQPSSLAIYDNILLIALVFNIGLILVYFFFFRSNSSILNPNYKYLKNSFYVALFLIFVWWLGFFSGLYEWVYRTSLGDVVSNMIKYDIEVYRLLFNILIYFGTFLFLSIFSLFLFLCISDLKKIRVQISTYHLYLLAIIPIPLLSYLLTVQSNPRKLGIVFVVIMILFSSKIISKNINRLYINGYLSIILFVLFISHLNFINTKHDNFLFVNLNPTKFIGKGFPSPITLSPNPHNVVIENLTSLSMQYNIKHITLPINEDSKPVDPFLLSMMSIGGKFSSNFPYSKKFVNNLDFISKYNYAFLINPLGKMIKSKKQSNLILEIIDQNNKSVYLNNNEVRKLSENQKYTYFLQYLYSSNKLKENGWDEVSCFDINEKYSGCLIKKIDNK
tara:strand:+ start:93 stop:1541 length:1449 start_codon:yes stop_codon:yes gene_type:complete